MERRSGDRRRPENHPRQDASGWTEDARTLRMEGRWMRPRASYKENGGGRKRCPVMVAARGEEEAPSESAGEAEEPIA